jgi:hypothetical protein
MIPRRLHRVASIVALATVATFFLSTLTVELIGNEAAIAGVKRLILYGMGVLIPAMIITGITGNRITGKRQGRLIQARRNRMLFVAANGLLILVPSAIILDQLAHTGQFGTTFYVIQGIELLAGATNITLLGLNMRSGFRLTGRLRRSQSVG